MHHSYFSRDFKIVWLQIAKYPLSAIHGLDGMTISIVEILIYWYSDLTGSYTFILKCTLIQVSRWLKSCNRLEEGAAAGVNLPVALMLSPSFLLMVSLYFGMFVSSPDSSRSCISRTSRWYRPCLLATMFHGIPWSGRCSKKGAVVRSALCLPLVHQNSSKQIWYGKF